MDEWMNSKCKEDVDFDENCEQGDLYRGKKESKGDHDFWKIELLQQKVRRVRRPPTEIISGGW